MDKQSPEAPVSIAHQPTINKSSLNWSEEPGLLPFPLRDYHDEKNIKLYPYQVQAIFELFRRERAPIRQGSSQHTFVNFTVLDAAPGSGKTWIAILLSMLPHGFRYWESSVHWMSHIQSSHPNGILRKIVDNVVVLDMTVLVVQPLILEQTRQQALHLGLVEKEDFIVLRSDNPRINNDIMWTENHVKELKGKKGFLLITDAYGLYKLKEDWMFSRLVIDEPEIISSVRAVNDDLAPLKYLKVKYFSLIFMTGSSFELFSRKLNKCWIMQLVKATKNDRELIKLTIDSQYIKECQALQDIQIFFHVINDSMNWCSMIFNFSLKLSLLNKEMASAFSEATYMSCYNDMVWYFPKWPREEVVDCTSRDDFRFLVEKTYDNIIKQAESSVKEADILAARLNNIKAQRKGSLKCVDELAARHDHEVEPINLKRDAIISIINKEPNKHILIFTRFNTELLFNMLFDRYRDSSYTVKLVRESKAPAMLEEAAAADPFTKPYILVADPDTFGRAANMQFVDAIIMCQTPTPETFNQWAGRAQRPGRRQGSALNVFVVSGKAESATNRDDLKKMYGEAAHIHPVTISESLRVREDAHERMSLSSNSSSKRSRMNPAS